MLLIKKNSHSLLKLFPVPFSYFQQLLSKIPSQTDFFIIKKYVQVLNSLGSSIHSALVILSSGDNDHLAGKINCDMQSAISSL